MNGCLSETAALAVLGGLLTFRRPEAYIDKETNQLVVLSLEESTPVKVHTHHLPVLISFALVDGKTFLVEPDQEEEEVCQTCQAFLIPIPINHFILFFFILDISRQTRCWNK